ncbi:CU044_5270 family protein [Nonomuraea sp. NEAU-A123]|uniref:CU044_5270 family protein n=1 Tax=Nonomuraea sp. NEAU-A123 TaxID=2839649 RepID=UPI001BE465C3|nr:CU044_5270 family protein [Nonomuraea sp. NEAU-A123]MBT2233600.1 CU044_5270 family protein [Nonomuraea sp. NEAU-A123]
MTDDLQEIRTSHDALPGPSATAIAKAKDLLAAEAVAERTPHTGSGKHRLLLRTAAVGLAAAVAAVAFLTGTDGGATPANAAELLQEAATAAARQQAPQPGQILYVNRTDQIRMTVWGHERDRSEVTQEINREYWIPAADPDGALTRLTYGKLRTHTGPVPTSMEAPGTVEFQRAGPCTVHVLSPTGGGNLPDDPDQLLARIRADAEASVRNERPKPGTAPPSKDQIERLIELTVTSRLVTLAQNPFPGPGLRAAVLDALSHMPTATMRTDLTDLAGRQGIGASIRYQGPDGWERTELIFEPGTYRFLGWQHLSEPPGGGVQGYASAVLETKIVNAMPKIPAGAPEAVAC